MYKQIIVCEGKNDERRLKEVFPTIETINTNGSEISQETIAVLKSLSQTRELVLFFDPDYPGQQIRAKISNAVKNCKHAFIKREDGISKNRKKIGVEHATDDVIRHALNNVLELRPAIMEIQTKDLFNLGLLSDKTLRIKVAERLHIGYTNGKTMVKRLNMFGITIEQLERAVRDEDWEY